MKRIFPLILFIIIAINSNAQVSIFEREVPQVVKKAFVEKYPDVTTVEWFKNNDSVIGAKLSLIHI